MSVHVVGSLNQDVFLSVPTLPAPGQTLAGSAISLAHGGKGLNQAVACARAGGVTTLVGCVGDDPAGVDLTAFARAAGVDVSGVSVSQDPTGTAHILRAADGENCIVVIAGANGAVAREQIEAGLAGIARGDIVVVQGEIPVSASDRAIGIAVESGARVVLNLAPVVEFSPITLQHADPLVVNEVEAGLLLQLSAEEVAADPRAAGARLLDLASSAVVTLGAAGAVVVEAGGISFVEAPRPDRVVDTTGAGDAFVGVLAARLSRGKSLDEAARSAVAAATFSVAMPGASDSYSDVFEEL